MAIRARCGFSGETLQGQAFSGPPPDCHDNPGSLIWNDQTARADRFLAWRFLPSANRTRQETALAQAKPAQAT
jgi:hypothetical protein